MIYPVLAARGQIGMGLAVGRGAVVSEWWLPDTNPGSVTTVGAYRAIGAASLAESYVNEANPGTQDLPGTGVVPSHAAVDGWAFNGSTQYLRTGIIPAAGYSMLVRFSNYVASAVGSVIAGGAAGNARFFAYPRRDSGSSNYRAYGYGGGVYNHTQGTGVVAGVIGFAASGCYYNGSLDGNASGTWSGTSVEIYIAAYNNNGSPLLYSNTKIQAIAIYSATLTGTQVAEVSTKMAALTG